MKRRDFIKIGLAAGVALPVLQKLWAGENQKTLRLAVIGTGSRGTGLLRTLLKLPGIEFPALCDIRPQNLERATNYVEKARGKRPEGYSKDEFDYRRMLERDDLDGVLIATPVHLHAQMGIDSMKAGKPTSCEVVAAETVEDCWRLIKTHEKTKVPYMSLENYVYTRANMMIRNMVEKGVFGEITNAECGYIHEIPFGMLYRNDELTWRGETRQKAHANGYPTHSMGPVCGWLGINRGDRLVRIVSMNSKSAARRAMVDKKYPEGHPVREMEWGKQDNNLSLIKTAKGIMISLRYDTDSRRPHNTSMYTLQGTDACYMNVYAGESKINILGKTKRGGWDALSSYENEYDHPYWKWRADVIAAEKAGGAVGAVSSATFKAWGKGHGGGDFLVLYEWITSLRENTPPPIDVYDAVTWASIQPLSLKSVRSGSAPVKIPDFTNGRWKKG
jgi:Glycosyl hydrolase 109, C-terminal domain/Oxidoreductase family, NAD-binding Rossmann fold